MERTLFIFNKNSDVHLAADIFILKCHFELDSSHFKSETQASIVQSKTKAASKLSSSAPSGTQLLG